MYMFKFFKRYIFNDMDGLLGKLNQHTDNYEINYNTISEPCDVINSKILEQLDDYPFPYSRGSVGYIYKAKWCNKDIIIKIISPEILKTIEEEKKTINILGDVKKNITDITVEISQMLNQESNLRLEKENCLILRDSQLHLNYNIKILKPIESLCDQDHFSYLYEEGIPILDILNLDIPKEQIHQIANRLVLYYYDLLHNKDILLGDLNPGNILYNHKLDQIIILDYGCVFELSEEKKKLLRKLNKASESVDGIRDLIKEWNGSKQLFELLFSQTRPFADLSGKKYLFQDIKTNVNPLDVKLYNIDFPSDIILIIRSCFQLVQLLKKLQIQDNYSHQLKKIIK